MQMLTVGVLSAGNAGNFGGSKGRLEPSEKSVAAFTIMLFMDYLVLTVLLVLWRGDLLPTPSMASLDESTAPPKEPHFGGAAPAYEDGGMADPSTVAVDMGSAPASSTVI